MPRVGRAVLPDYPHHIIQRGHNRQVVFAEAGDFKRYLETLADFKEIYGVKVYAWRLMTIVAQVETILGKRIENRSRGRPSKISPVQHESQGK